MLLECPFDGPDEGERRLDCMVGRDEKVRSIFDMTTCNVGCDV